MSTYTQILYQLIFSTKYRNPTLLQPKRQELYNYIQQILVNNNCFVYQIGGVEDHTHIVFTLHPNVALAKLVKDIKVGSNYFIKEKSLFPHFEGWQYGYGAFTYSIKAKRHLIAYVKNQEQHHKTQSSTDELKQLLNKFQIEYDEKYFI